jgi:hypothetical protein
MTRRDFTIPLALAALACLLAMLAITVATGISQETYEVVRPAAEYANDLRAHDGAVRALFAIDSAFLVVYAAFFLVFGRHVATDETRTLISVGTAFILITAFLDMVEDHHILAMLAAARGGVDPSPAALVAQHVVSQVKFNVSYLALFLFGLAIPRQTTLGLILSLLLTVGTLLQGAWLYMAPPSLLPAGNVARALGYILAFILAIPFVRAQSRGV